MTDERIIQDIEDEESISSDPANGHGLLDDVIEEQKPLDLLKDEEKGTEKKPTPIHGRLSVAELVSWVWSGLGMFLVQTGVDPPVGRVLQFQAPIAGSQLDELIKGTWIDPLLQPLARSTEKAEGVGALLLFPLLVGAYERTPEIGPVIAPLLREVVEATLADMAPALKKRQQLVRRAASAVSELSDVLQLQPGEDPIDAILGSIFAPNGSEDQPSE